MSDQVKLSAALPGDPDTNGVDTQAPTLVADPETIRVAVLWYDVSKVTISTDTGARVPTIRVRRIEPLGTVLDVPDTLRQLVGLGSAWQGGAWKGEVGPGEARPGVVGRGLARSGAARHGPARFGVARRGKEKGTGGAHNSTGPKQHHYTERLTA